MPNKCVVKSQMMISSKMYWQLIHHEIMIQKNNTTHNYIFKKQQVYGYDETLYRTYVLEKKTKTRPNIEFNT